MMAYRVWSLLALCLTLVACAPDFDVMAQKRLEYARKNQDDIQVVAFQDIFKSNYINGVLLAAEEINQRPGKLLKRTLQVSIEQDEATFEDSKPTIRRIAANPKISAVLGHRSSSIAIPASVIYEHSQIIFISPFSTAQGLTAHNFQYVFRMAPNAEVLSEQLASVAKVLGYKKIVVLYSRDDLSRQLAFLFEEAAVQRPTCCSDEGIDIVQNSSFFAKESNYRSLISQFSGKEFDALFIAAPGQPGATMVRQLREMGINKPILGSDAFNQPSYLEAAGNAANDTIIPALYRPNAKNPVDTVFIQRYRRKYNAEPDYNAAQGYDSMMLLASAIEKAGSTIPPLLSSTMHYMPAWLGATGLHAYDQKGDLRGKKYVFNVVHQGQLSPMPAIHIPYLLSRFEKDLPVASPTTPAVQTDKDEASFTQTFSKRMDEVDHKIHLLDLAQTILRFKRIGIIYENTESGRTASGYNIVKQMAESKGLDLVGCDVPFSALARAKIEEAFIACYGKLSLDADALFVVPYEGINQSLTSRLNQSLSFFNVPSIFLGTPQKGANITLSLAKRSDVDPDGRGDMTVYKSLLGNIQVHELADRLQGLPEISVNLESLQQLGLPDKALMDLSPDSFLQSQNGAGAKP